MKTTIDETGYLIAEPDDNYIVFVGTPDELEKYRLWYSRANKVKKPKVLEHNVFIVRPVKEKRA